MSDVKRITSVFRTVEKGPRFAQVENHRGDTYVLRASALDSILLNEFLEHNKIKIGYPINKILSFNSKKKTFLVSWLESRGFPDDPQPTRWPNWNLAVSDLPLDKQMSRFIKKQPKHVQTQIKKLYRNLNESGGAYPARKEMNQEFKVFEADEEDPDTDSEAGSNLASSSSREPTPDDRNCVTSHNP